MKKKVSLALLVSLAVAGCNSNDDSSSSPAPGTPSAHIIPAPAQLSQGAGSWPINDSAIIAFEAGLENEASYLADKFSVNNGLNLDTELLPAVGEQPEVNSIELVIDSSAVTAQEGYTLEVLNDRARIVGHDEAGVFYGVQSLIQLAPLTGNLGLPIVTIEDAPRFEWRGMHLDVGRHMFAVEDIKKFIDWMAFHKLNKFHWHLTEDQGWRIEIKGWPLLTEVGGYRESTPPYGDRYGSDGTPYGGYYTQDEVRDVVAYAMERHIEVIPEIDLPGHMSAAITAYPELGVQDSEGFDPKVQTTWGVFPYLMNVEESTFAWLDEVFTQVAELFPSQYIHLGGDEAIKDQWESSPSIQAKIEELGLIGGEHDLQSWVVSRVEDIITSKGRIAVGWDEILEGGQTPGVGEISTDTIVMYWRGWLDTGATAARRGHPIIMSDGFYFDFYQAPEELELEKGVEYEAIGHLRPLEAVYHHDPIPKNLEPEYHHQVLGGQGQLWTEYMHTWDKLEYMAFPRIAALSEVVWSPKDQRNYDNFLERLDTTFTRYDAAGINYAEVYDTTSNRQATLNDGTHIQTTLGVNYSNGLENTRDFDKRTFFWSDGTPEAGDTITYQLASPLSEGYIHVLTGLPENPTGDALADGVLEASTDGENWQYQSDFVDGEAVLRVDSPVSHFRIRVTENGRNWLAIREVRYGTVDTIEEHSEEGSFVTKVTPRNPDLASADLTYRIKQGNPALQSAYAIDEHGNLTVNNSQAVNYESLIRKNGSILQEVVVEITNSDQSSVSEQHAVYIELTSIDESGQPGFGRWEETATADAETVEPVFLTSSPVKSLLPVKIDLSEIRDNATYEFFVSMADVGQSNAILLRDNDVGMLKHEQRTNSGKYGATLLDAAEDYLFSPVAGESVNSRYGELTHVVFVVFVVDSEASETQLYLDGVLSGTLPKAIEIKSFETMLGDTLSAPLNRAGTDSIQAFAAYNTALKGSQVLERYQAYAGVQP